MEPELTTTGDVAAQAVVETPAPQQNVVTNESFLIGYVVGLTPDGNFVFEVVGKNKEVVGLMGIHKYAEFEVQRAFEANRMAGDSLTFEVGRAVAALNQKVDALLKAQKPADNKL